ncbi:MAG: BTAD domain-containing putative transcriptional regulator [Caldilineales bacterium]
MTDLHLRFLGPPKIERDGAPVELDTRKATAALAYLVLASPRAMQTRDTLAALLYPDYAQDRARAAFRRTLSSLRAGVGADILQSNRESVSLPLQSGTVWCDVLRFRALIDRCKGHGHSSSEVCEDCLPLLEEAAALYTGDFMAGFSLRDSVTFDDWQLFEAEALRQEFSGVLERLVRGKGAQGNWQQAIEMCHRWITLDPLHEPGHRRLMQLYAWNGQRSAALRQYRDCVRILDEELGVPPLPETTALYQAIIERAESEPHATADAWRILARDAHPAPPEPARQAPAAPRLTTGVFSLVGRDKPLAALNDMYARADAGQFVVIEGEAGIGKTRLAEEFVQAAACQGAATVVARCYEGDARLAYGPIVDALRAALAAPDQAARLAELPTMWLSEARRMAPEIGALDPSLLPAADLDGPGAQARFFEAIAQAFLAALAGAPPGVLLLDDVQWADEATLDMLTFLTRRLRGQPLLFLATLRSEQSAAGERAAPAGRKRPQWPRRADRWTGSARRMSKN